MNKNISKQNKWLFGTAIVLLMFVLLMVYFSFSEKQQRVDDAIFQVEDWKEIQNINLKSIQAEVSLAYTDGAWRVNNRYKADRNLIDIIFATLIQAKPKREITGSQKDTLLKQINKNGIRITLGNNIEKELTFFAGGNTQKTNAYFVDKENKVYLMHIPGYRVYVSGIFELTEGEWIDKLIFDINWVNFKKLVYTHRGESFNVVRNKNLFQIEGLATDTAKLHQFLDRVSLLQVNQYELTIKPNQVKTIGELVLSDLADRTYSFKISDSVRANQRLVLVKESLAAWVSESNLQVLLKSRNFYQKTNQ
jgi:hypothetical protein